VRLPISKRDLLRRIEALEARLEKPTPRPMDGQEAIDLDDEQDDGALFPMPPQSR
jgi:hypothetical protein